MTSTLICLSTTRRERRLSAARCREKWKASTWLDKNRPVEQMTWVPGEPIEIRDRLIVNGGWIEREGKPRFQPLPCAGLEADRRGNADRWVHHVERLYGEDAVHIVRWCAHRVQKPADKMNHALVLGGKQGIGKDTLLEPVKHAIGAWNFNRSVAAAEDSAASTGS